MDWKTITLPLTATTPILSADKNSRGDHHADHANGNADKKSHFGHHGDHAGKKGDENHADELLRFKCMESILFNCPEYSVMSQ